MEITITFADTLMPILLFGLALFIGIIPRPKNHKISKYRVVWCGIEIALGLYLIVSSLLTLNFELGYHESQNYAFGVIILGWGIYEYFTSPSHLSRTRKFLKIVCFILISLFSLIGISPFTNEYGLILFHPEIRNVCLIFNFILIICLYFIIVPNLKNRSDKTRKINEEE